MATNIPNLPPAPLRGENPDEFNAKANAFVPALDPWGQALNALGQEVATNAANVSQNATLVAEGAEYVETNLPIIIDNADRAESAKDESELIAQGISDTTTIDFVSFEINEAGELLVHFAGYADAANFYINNQGELEVVI